ncbi:hypothetical protein DIPPA_14464 [Diplonema papillatum]|nr:hypothetical protein DIPPA_14464 [Diplonema papillatum]
MADEDDVGETSELDLQLTRADPENWESLFNDEAKLVCTLVMLGKCPHSEKVLPHVNEIAKKTEEFPNTSFVLLDADVVPDAAKSLGVLAVPAFFFSLKGQVLDSFAGSNPEKFTAMLKNALHKRNEAMKEEDAKRAAEQAAAAASPDADE